MHESVQYKRVTIGPLARDIYKRGPQTPLRDLTSFPRDFNLSALWGELKPEMYALSAVMIDQIMNHALSSELTTDPQTLQKILRPPQTQPYDMFSHLADYTRHGLSTAVHKKIADFGSLPDDTPLRKTSERHRLIAQFHADFLHYQDMRSKLNNSSYFIGRGNITASSTMARFLEVIPYVREKAGYKLPQDPEFLAGVAERSYPFLTALANQHLTDLEESNNRLRDSSRIRYDPQEFIIKDTKRGPMVTPKDPKFAEISTNSDKTNADPLVSCPAMVVIEGKSSIKRLWDLFVRMAPVIYAEFFDQLTNSAPKP